MTADNKYGENNYPKAVAISTALLVGFIVLSFFIIINSATPEDVGTGGIVVNFGTAQMGMGDDMMSIDEPSIDPNANNALPDKVVETTPDENPSVQTSDKSIVTQNTEDAPEVVTEEKASTNNPSTTAPTKESKPTVNTNALYKGKRMMAAARVMEPVLRRATREVQKATRYLRITAKADLVWEE